MPSTPWFNENANRAYPFLVGTVDADSDGPLSTRNLDDGLVLDAGFVAAAKSRFETGVHSVYLAAVQRSGTRFFLEFGSDAPELFGVPLVFTRHLDDPEYTFERTDSGRVGLSGSSDSASAECDEPLWSGHLVTGKMDLFALLLPADGRVSRSAGASVVEPALVQNLAGSYVVRLGLANDDRTRVTPADGCEDMPAVPPVVHVHDRCIRGDVVFRAGFNAIVRQNTRANSITLGAAVGAGEGQPCDTVPLYAGESPPDGSTLLEGGVRCNETVRAVNGLGGPQLVITAGSGVTVTSSPETNTVVIDVNLTGLAFSATDVSQRSESC